MSVNTLCSNGVRAMLRTVLASATVLLVAVSALRADITLKLGDPPPPVAVAKWIRPPERPPRKDKIRIVTFFSSWSAPCRQALPVLQRVAQKYKNAVIEAISVYEKASGPKDTSYFRTVEAFVKQMGSTMPYAVGIDGPSGAVANAWLEASGERGVPTSFIIGRNGKIVWIGHTMMLDTVMEEILTGRFDFKRYAEQRAAQLAEEEKEYRLLKRFNELSTSGHYREAVQELDRIARQHPEYGRRMVLVRFNLLLKCDEAEAYKFGRELLQGELKDQSGMLWLMARMLLDETPGLKSPDYKLAYDLASRSAELTKYQDANILTALAYANFKLGNVDRAIELQEKAIPIGDANPQIPERNKKLMRERLEMFKKAKAQGAGNK